ncbi:Pre-protein translocase, SecY subunit [Elusimicrobium minutum Pei191]|uniref:Protein translocase subunit SecY n=1 Tax=Elusimicrobium minutum (strain Pei191) TaxID=445932 RepID=B2KEK2_ELUMP|nr:preprotein translocase subunit SecY [Elusimicrobium minutum]ACC98948.1 Pre-protein translocase, SecY subunit [Elusimicrobium minutum Pei191]
MANNTVANIFNAPELKKRLLFVLGAIFVFRVAAAIPIPGINTDVIKQIFAMQQHGVLGFLDIFSGGAMSRFSILALGIMPYINASIIMGLVRGAHLIPALDRMHKEGEAGRRKENQITRVFALILACVQGFGLTFALGKMSAPGGISAIVDPSIAFYITTTLTLATGTMFVMWLGEQITEKGIGNGISLIIFAGIVDRLPSAVMKVVQLVQAGEMQFFSSIAIFAAVIIIMILVVWVETAQRQIPVQYAKRQIGNKVYGGQTSYLPLKIDQSGVIAVIFASSIIYMPLTIAGFNPESTWAIKITEFMGRGHLAYFAIFASLIIFFCYFYNSMTINPSDLAENMKKNGGFIPGIRPGEPTKNYLEWVLNRITLSGAIFVCLIAIMPDIARIKFNVPFYFGGTSLLIVVGVALDTAGQIQAHLMARDYEPLMKAGKKLSNRRWFNVGE